MDPNLYRPFAGIFLLSVALPIGIYFGRNNIRARRRALVEDLMLLFSYAKTENNEDLIIPSVELVRYKYAKDFKSSSKYNSDSEGSRNDGGVLVEREEEDSFINSAVQYSFSVFIYVVITFLGFMIAFFGP